MNCESVFGARSVMCVMALHRKVCFISFFFVSESVISGFR